MAHKIIVTDVQTINADQEIDLGINDGVMDISFLNQGTSTVVLKTKTGSFTLAVGDSMLTFGGYEGYYRQDVFDIEFGVGSNSLLVFSNIHQNIDHC